MGFVFQPWTIFVLELVPAGVTNEYFLRRIISHNNPSEEKQTVDLAEDKPSESFFLFFFFLFLLNATSLLLTERERERKKLFVYIDTVQIHRGPY